MARSRRRRPGLLPTPSPKPEPETLPPLFSTPSSKPNQPGPGPRPIACTTTTPPTTNPPEKQILPRAWSKSDVIVIMKGMVDFIAQKGIDPMNNVDTFVDFINNNSSSLSTPTGHICNKITWQLRKSGDSKSNYILHLETDSVGNNSSTSRSNNKRNKNSGSVVCDKKSNLGKNVGRVKAGSGKNDGVSPTNIALHSFPNPSFTSVRNNCEVGCFTIPNSVKKGSVGEKKANWGKNDGGVSPTNIDLHSFQNSCFATLGNDGGISCLTIPNSVKKSSVGEKKTNLGKNDGGVKCSSILYTVKKSTVGEKKLNSGDNDGGVGANSVKEKSSVIVKKSELETDYGGQKCTKTQNNLKKQNGVGAKKSKLGARVRRKTKTIIVVGKKAIPKPKGDGGKKKNNDKGTCGQYSIVQAKKGGMKNNGGILSDFGFWDKNQVILREAVTRMISRRLSLRDELQIDISWSPPKIGVLKWNTDASLREDDRMTAIGGVLRDWNGSFRCVFSCPVDCCDINEAEVIAIYKALELASYKDWLLSLDMVIESDSMSAVKWCNEDNDGPSKLSYMLSFIRECRMWWPGLEITYMGRKSNSVADRLAKQGHQRKTDFVAWM